MAVKLTRKNVERYLIGCIGIAKEEVSLMPDYVKIDLIRDDYELFREFIEDEFEQG